MARPPVVLEKLHPRVMDKLMNDPRPYDPRFSPMLTRQEYETWPTDQNPKMGRFKLYLNTLVDLLKPQKILELGTDQGASAAFMLSALPPEGTLITVDIARRDLTPLSRFLDDPRLSLVHGDDLDLEIYGELSLKEIDLLFIDTDHRYEQISGEWTLYKRFLSRHSVVALDDIFFNSSMRRFWDELPYVKFETARELHTCGFGVFSPTQGSVREKQDVSE